MKKIIAVVAGLTLITSFGCKDVKKETEKATKAVKIEESYKVNQDSTSVKFTAYKTTAKKGVGGKFTTINLKNTKAGASVIEAMNGLQFSIPVSSLFTNDATNTRDAKITEFFFGVMANTELISGTLSFDSSEKCALNIVLNGVTAKIPMEYTITDRHITLSGVMNLEDWNALDAVSSLNKVCEELHKGDDGISKTWNDVAIEATTYLE